MSNNRAPQFDTYGEPDDRVFIMNTGKNSVVN